MASMEEDRSDGASFLYPPEEEGLDDGLPQCKIKRNYSCNLCSFFSQNPRSFLYHMRDIHFDKIKIYECSQCLYASKHSQKLQRHINMIHASHKRRAKKVIEKKIIEKKPVYEEVLPIGEELVEQTMILDETDMGDGEVDVKCSMCSFTSRSATLMRRHEKVAHMKKKFLRCAKCSYVTHVKARFTKHVKYHSMPMIKCDLCDFRTPYKWNLDRHYKNHCGSGAFQCSKCNFRADIKQSLTVHEMNHHVPPVGAGAAVLMRKRNKVGASETMAFESDGIDQDELELLRLEREDEDYKTGREEEEDDYDYKAMVPSKLHSALKRPMIAKKPYGNNSRFIHPNEVASTPVKSFKCKSCNYRASFPQEMARHEKKVHGLNRDKRPPPNLIPIQGNSTSPILKIPDIRNQRLQPEEPTPPVDEEEFNKLCKKSSLTSSLKEFVSLIGDEDGLKTIPDTSEEELESENKLMKDTEDDEDDDTKETQTDMLKRKNASFFDKLKEKLMNGGSQEGSLTCELCGHESKSLSESTTHEKMHLSERNEMVLSGSELSSTRCQHCRQRCKTSADLINHLNICPVFNATFESQGDEQVKEEDLDNSSSENKVFVWTDYSRNDDEYTDGDIGDNDYLLDNIPECSVELTEGASLTRLVRLPKPLAPSMKKVFKCPHCSFWASTASRFHVHIVGHLNKKPFECSLCNYRSNWRWDITKHIRLKSARDPSHGQATVNMTDETGRRNYSKYNKYLTMMKVAEPTADSSGTGRRTRACEATQGTVTDDDILQPIPAPPQLIPAPQLANSSSSLHTNITRPPPLLQGGHSSNMAKRTLWKCKKCLFRHSNKDKVLVHVKSHYGKKDGESSDGIEEGEEQIKGNSSGETTSDGEKDASLMEPPSPSFENAVEQQFAYACDICPFTAENADDLTAHKLNHVDRPGSIFKCTYCPFYVPSKIAVLEHMEIHGGERDADALSLKIENFDPSECSIGDIDSPKRFQCRQCPYVSNSKTQFMYHRQFHRPRDTPFKCLYCSYNVSRRHLLHQHLRVHHTYKSGKTPTKAEIDEDISDVLVVWVNRGGSYLKMYRCRWCPFVGLRRANVIAHEREHEEKNEKLHCSECEFICSTPNELTSHVKTHRDFTGDTQIVEIDGESPSAPIVEPEVVLKVDEPEIEMSTPEKSYYQSRTIDDETKARDDLSSKFVSFCHRCPARFLHKKELRIHSKFHLIRLPFKCEFCSYTARQRPHLLAHYKVHSQSYQERTAALIDTYMICADHQQPQKAIIAKESVLIEGPVWAVIPTGNGNCVSGFKVYKQQSKHSCHRCPAKFFKAVALEYHLTLHGAGHQHKCKYCDYAVKTYGNLIKHQLVHESAVKKSEVTSPMSELKAEADDGSRSPSKKPDPQFGTLMHGSPDFIYPTYLKNGRLREKRYKCHKCPSAFEKRDQYRIHLSLHGSKQKYKCEKCDYSVKYYANYIQHMKKHQHNDSVKQVRKGETTEEPINDDNAFMLPNIELTMLEKQTLLLESKRRGREEDKKLFYCQICPYSNLRKDCLENHEHRHYQISGARFAFECDFCDYSATQVNFLREHIKLHFKPNVLHQPEAFLKADKTELWYTDEDKALETAVPFFQDLGEDIDERFHPELEEDERLSAEVEEENRIYIDPVTFEAVAEEEAQYLDRDAPNSPTARNELENCDNEDDLIEMVQVQYEVSKPKIKRMRGKNLICRKCPHAFGKRDQFLRHISLHGSKQRYSCDICDYSVKFYTNYVQHMRMHQSHEPNRQIQIKQYVFRIDGGCLKEDKQADESSIEEATAGSDDFVEKIDESVSGTTSPQSEDTSLAIDVET